MTRTVEVFPKPATAGAALSGTTPLALGTAAAGVGTEGSRWDHIHPKLDPFPVPAVGFYFLGPVVVTSTHTMTLNRLSFTPFLVAVQMTLDRIALSVSTAATTGLARLGFYTDVNGVPSSRVVELGTIDITTTGDKELTINQTLTPGLYWVGTVAQGTGSPVCRGISAALPASRSTVLSELINSASAPVGYIQSAVTGALPATAVPAGTPTTAPRIALRRSA